MSQSQDSIEKMLSQAMAVFDANSPKFVAVHGNSSMNTDTPEPTQPKEDSEKEHLTPQGSPSSYNMSPIHQMGALNLDPEVTSYEIKAADTKETNGMNGYHTGGYDLNSMESHPGNLSARSEHKRLIDNILTQYKVALTFLFHDNSPLHAQFRDKNTHQRTAIFNVDKNTDFKLFETQINKLYHKAYASQHDKIYNGIWKEWKQFIQKTDNINLEQYADTAHQFIIQNDQRLLDVIEDFRQSKYVLKRQNENSLLAWGRALTKRDNPNLDSTKPDLADQSVRDMKENDFDIIAPEEYLQKVTDRRQLREWIEKYKLNSAVLRKRFCHCCERSKYSEESAAQRELDLSLPMELWTADMVVAFIEANEDLKHMASAFWEFGINGKELCKMSEKQIALLIECSMLNNNYFDEVDLDALQQSTDEWKALTDEVTQLIHYRNKSRILSYTVSKYHLTIDVIHEVISDSQSEIFNEFFVDARYILDVIQFLRAKPMHGPKQYWKMEAYFFNIIDNYLSVLICGDLVRNAFCKCNIDFLTEPDKPPLDLAQQIIAENVVASKRMSRKKTKSMIGLGTDVHKSGGNAIKSITNRLNLMVGIGHEVHRSSVAEMKQDMKDRLETSCMGFMRNRDTIYVTLLFLVGFFLLIGAVFIILWWDIHSIVELEYSMHLAINALGERVTNEMTKEFWVAQMLTSITIGALYNGDLVKNASVYNGKYERFFAQFHNIPHTESIFSLYMYNDEDNTILGAYRALDSDTIMIGHFNGTCVFDYEFGKINKDTNMECNTYDPRTRPWYDYALSNPERAEWTNPYLFNEHNGSHYGMSLVSGIEFDGTFIIILCEIIVDYISNNAFPNDMILPQGSVIMVATHALDIFASSNNEIHLTFNCTDCTSSNSLIVSASEYLKTHQISSEVHESMEPMDFGYISIFSFKMIYLNFIPDINGNETDLIRPLLFEDMNDYQYGYIVIANDDSYLNHINLAFYTSFIVTGLILSVTIALICYNMKTHHALTTQRVLETVSTRCKSVEAFLEMTQIMALKNLDSNHSYASKKSVKAAHTEPQIGDRVITKHGKTGIVEYVSSLEEDTAVKLVALKSLNNETIFTSVANITIQNPDIDRYDNEEVTDLGMEQKSSNDKYESDNDNVFDVIEEKQLQKEQSISVEQLQMHKALSEIQDLAHEKHLDKPIQKSCFYCSQKNLLTTTCLMIFGTFAVLILIWISALDESKTGLVYDVFAKQEFGSVQDKVNTIYTKTEIVKNIIIERNNRGDMDLDNNESRNRFLVNLMQAFVDPHPIYGLFYIYFGTPDGRFYGVRWSTEEYNYKLKVAIRDESTGWALQILELYDNVTIVSDPDQDFTVYDPRCRVWYQRGMTYTFKGTAQNAFPNVSGGWNGFISDDAIVATTPNCEASRVFFANMFDVSLDNTYTTITSNASEYMDNTYEYTADTYNVVWSRYIFTTLGQIGLTASTAIQDENTGDLLGILGLDFTLDQLSLYLSDSVHESEHDNETSKEWLAWIFDANPNKPEMIASSDFQVLRSATSTEGCFGLGLNSAGNSNRVPWWADQHPNYYIRTLSEEVLNVTQIHNLEINEALSLVTPIDFPIVQVSRISFAPVGGEGSIDWIVIKTVSDESADTVDNTQITLYVSFALIAAVLVIMKEIDYVQNAEDDELGVTDLDRKDPNYYYLLMEKMKPIIIGSSNAHWGRIVEDDALDELNTDNMFNLDILEESKSFDVDIVTTNHAKQYMANKANELISNETDFRNKLTEFAMEASECNEHRLNFFRFTETALYAIPNQLILFIHGTTTLFEPSTPKQLKQKGLGKILIYVTAFCILCEFLDVLCIYYRRYVEFSIKYPFLTSLYELNYGVRHKSSQIIRKWRKSRAHKIKKRLYLVFFGPNSTLFLIHIFINTLILFDFLTRVFYKTGYLSYYFPVLPILLIIRNETILEFCREFVFAVLFAKDVLFSYLCFMLIFSLLSMSLYRTVVNQNDFSESFENITEALITSFVYISTAENYTFMYDVFDSEYYSEHSLLLLLNALFVSLSCTFIGLFIFIPMIIHRFELAFEESKILSDQENTARKENAIIASFILLDMNGDLDIDEREFQSLVTTSILVDKKKLFESFDENTSDGIDINEFVRALLKQTFRTKIMSMKIPQQRKVRAWIECNILRHRLYQTWVLIILVLPFLLVSLIKGVSHSFSESNLNRTLYVLFILNFVEIHFRMFTFGIRRYCDLLKYLTPNYVAAAIEKYQTHSADHTDLLFTDNSHNNVSNNSAILNEIRLTAADRMWVFNHLKDVRPYSLLEKTTLSLINKIELTLIWVTLLLFIAANVAFYYYYPPGLPQNARWVEMNERYCVYFIQLGILMRIFLIIPSNQKLVYVVFTVFPQFMSLFAFLLLFIYFWARIGCTLFGDNRTAIVIEDVYDQAGNIDTNFDTLWYSMLALLQLMVGEGWHEIMYYNVIATHPLMAGYFIVYIIAVTIIISNVFVGLFLADIDELSMQQSNDEIAQNSNKTESFEKYAKYQLSILNYKLKKDDLRREQMQKQVDHIEELLYRHKLKNKIKYM